MYFIEFVFSIDELLRMQETEMYEMYETIPI